MKLQESQIKKSAIPWTWIKSQSGTP